MDEEAPPTSAGQHLTAIPCALGAVQASSLWRVLGAKHSCRTSQLLQLPKTPCQVPPLPLLLPPHTPVGWARPQ